MWWFLILGSTSGVVLSGVRVSYAQMISVAVAAAAVAGLYIFLRTARLGVAMRGVVDNPKLLALSGTAPIRVRVASWVIGAVFASLSGVLLAPTLSLDANLLTLLVVQAFGACAIGLFSSLPLTYVGGLIVSGQMFFLIEYTWDVQLHSVIAYIAMGIALPLVFAMLSQASRYKWAASSTAAVYMIFAIAEILMLPLFPAQPKLGPVFNPVTHLVPAKFPILIFVPALSLDLLWQKTTAWKPWKVALASGFLFIAVLTIVEWPFANFLLSKASENRFFGTIYFDYNSRPNGYDRLRLFFKPDHGAVLYFGLLRAAIYASISAWIGLGFGRWMRSVQR